MKAIDTLNTAGVPLWDCFKKGLIGDFLKTREATKCMLIQDSSDSKP